MWLGTPNPTHPFHRLDKHGAAHTSPSLRATPPDPLPPASGVKRQSPERALKDFEAVAAAIKKQYPSVKKIGQQGFCESLCATNAPPMPSGTLCGGGYRRNAPPLARNRVGTPGVGIVCRCLWADNRWSRHCPPRLAGGAQTPPTRGPSRSSPPAHPQAPRPAPPRAPGLRCGPLSLQAG